MKTAAVRELRNHYSNLLDDVAAGEEVIITKHGKPVAKLGPAGNSFLNRVHWSESPEVRRDRSQARSLTEDERNDVLEQSSGRW